jgi:hypothetical protein
MCKSIALLSLSLNGAVVPNFKCSNDLKYPKIMTQGPPLYTPRDIRDKTKWFGVDCFYPRYSFGGSMWSCTKTMVFTSAHFQSIKVHASFLPNVVVDR